MPKYCEDCGSKLTPGKSFCGNCGEEIKVIDQVTVQDSIIQRSIIGSAGGDLIQASNGADVSIHKGAIPCPYCEGRGKNPITEKIISIEISNNRKIKKAAVHSCHGTGKCIGSAVMNFFGQSVFHALHGELDTYGMPFPCSNGKCSRCNGKGKISLFDKCPICIGTGTCIFCKGSGKCTICKGDGCYETCKDCNGSGIKEVQ